MNSKNIIENKNKEILNLRYDIQNLKNELTIVEDRYDALLFQTLQTKAYYDTILKLQGGDKK